MLERVILIVDDSKRIEEIYIPSYLAKIEELKQKDVKWKDYNFKLIHRNSMKGALEYLAEPQNLVDVLVVDYDFCGERTFSNGTAFVKHIRENVNRYCQIVFYTMQGLNSIDKEELTELINSDVFKIVDKSEDVTEMGKIIFEAATRRNPIVESLEHFLIKYKTLLETYNYTVGGQKVSFNEIINHIRMDDAQGRILIEKLLQKAILLDTDIEE